MTACPCIGHFERDTHGHLVWVVDVPDWNCTHPLHRRKP
jgi:hypothetical protein